MSVRRLLRPHPPTDLRRAPDNSTNTPSMALMRQTNRLVDSLDRPPQMSIDLSALDDLQASHEHAGRALFASCSAELFPCDVLAYSALERSLHLIKGYRAVVGNGGYSSAVGILRMQLDNILRFHGVVLTKNPHQVASDMLRGTPLSKIKDRTGAAMRDARLVELFEKRNPWVRAIYKLASGYIHLSQEHMLHFLSRCPVKPDGTRDFSIGDEEDHIPNGHKEALQNGFIIVSRGVPLIINQWAEVRNLLGSNNQLKAHFSKSF